MKKILLIANFLFILNKTINNYSNKNNLFHFYQIQEKEQYKKMQI
jgi:hypothetical protein